MRVSALQQSSNTRLSEIAESLEVLTGRAAPAPVVNVDVKVPEQPPAAVTFKMPEPLPEKLKIYEVTVTAWTEEGRIKKLRFEQKA